MDMAALSEKLESISRVVRQTQAAATTAGGAQQTATNALEPNSAAAVAAEVLQTAASESIDAQAAGGAKTPALDELSLDDENVDDNRNKRCV